MTFSAKENSRSFPALEDGIDLDSVTCPICRITFKQEKDRRDHLDRFHVKDVREKCKLCNLHFPDIETLRHHVQQRHNRYGPSHVKVNARGNSKRTDHKANGRSQQSNDYYFHQPGQYSVSTKNRYDPLYNQGNF